MGKEIVLNWLPAAKTPMSAMVIAESSSALSTASLPSDTASRPRQRPKGVIAAPT